jgi:transcription elongation factor Elf1
MGQRRSNGEGFTTRQYVFACPHCGERISMLLDLSAGSQSYVEDCEVCCNPIEISYQSSEGRIVSFAAREP